VSDHEWTPEEPVEGSSDDSHLRISCLNCQTVVTYPASFNSFQKRLSIAMRWMDDISVFDHEARCRELGLSKSLGYHGFLSQNCEEAQLFNLVSVMES
jgi:hypothetical protein